MKKCPRCNGCGVVPTELHEKLSPEEYGKEMANRSLKKISFKD